MSSPYPETNRTNSNQPQGWFYLVLEKGINMEEISAYELELWMFLPTNQRNNPRSID